ncbi:MAG: AAC(3) family N-acetyltransferase [Chloroflexota bacterium]|nr:AAC(3) family N-acetyltransferase [Chloroflexota bacterium]
MSATVTGADITQAIQATDLSNSIVCLHSSLKSLGHVEGGADTVIQAFLESGCTLIVPTFTYTCGVAPARWIPQNGLDMAGWRDTSEAQAYAPANPMIARDMGIIPARVLLTPGRHRGQHPLNSFTALGPRAKHLITAQAPLNVYGPLKQVYASNSAYLVLLGVDLTRATAIHYAEECAGRRLFRRWAKDVATGIVEVEVGSCSEGFNRLAPFVSWLERRVEVGTSVWRSYPFRQFIDQVTKAIRANPSITHCDDQQCVRCRDAVRGGPLL